MSYFYRFQPKSTKYTLNFTRLSHEKRYQLSVNNCSPDLKLLFRVAENLHHPFVQVHSRVDFRPRSKKLQRPFPFDQPNCQ